jgi:U3 small nucleolar RNA-associated protein 14
LYLPSFQIVKKPGIIIKPIQYEEVNPHEKPDEPKRVIQRATPNQKAKKAFAKQGKGATSQKRK